MPGLLDALVDLFFPKRCAACGAAGDWLCAGCREALAPLPAARCPRCGAPDMQHRPAAQRAGDAPAQGCRECRGRDLAFAGASAAFVYEGPARALVTACKFRALRSIAAEMAELAGPAFAAAVACTQTDCVTCVPGHRGRSLERGFNQAELLARALAAGGLRFEPLLVRVREGGRQSGLDRAGRAANVRGLYALNNGADRVLDGIERVVIVDDVYTTGETLNHCAGVLADRGLQTRAFTFARTVRRSRSRTLWTMPANGMPSFKASQPQP
jgi:ComF family protein